MFSANNAHKQISIQFNVIPQIVSRPSIGNVCKKYDFDNVVVTNFISNGVYVNYFFKKVYPRTDGPIDYFLCFAE